MTEKMISRLIDMGCRRWTKGEHDRLYIDSAVLGLQVERYKTGNISYAEFRGERISNSRAADLADIKIWIDLHTGELHTKGFRSAACATMREAAEELIEATEAEIVAAEAAEQTQAIALADFFDSVFVNISCEAHENADGSYSNEFDTYRLTHVLSDRLVIVSKYYNDCDADEDDLAQEYLLYKYSDGWAEIYTGCRRHSIIEELSDGSAYADLGIGSHGKFAGIIKSIVDASGILNT